MADRAEVFARKLERFGKNGPRMIVHQMQTAIMRQVYMYVMLYTPIDTGRLRGNWKIGIDKRPSGSSMARRTTATTTGTPATADEIAYVETFAKALNAAPLGRVVWIGNLTHYAKFVEHGYRHAWTGKKMPPRKMLARAAHSALLKVSRGRVQWRRITDVLE